MDINQIEQFLNALGSITELSGDWVRTSCPLAPYLHKAGKDTKPSFGMTPEIGGSRYHCFTCTSGSGSSLLATLEMYVKADDPRSSRYDLAKAREILESGALNVTRLKEYEDRSLHKEFYEWSEWELDQYPSAITNKRAMAYLTGSKSSMFYGTQQKCRGLTVAEVSDYNFRYDAYRDMVGIPFYDQFGRLAGLRGRGLTVKTFHDYTFHGHNNTDLTWCNEQCFQNDEIVVAVEGQFDMINSNRVYPNTIANLTARISERKLSKLLDCQGVVFMLDNDEAGLGARETAMEYLAKHGQRVGYATYAGHDPDMLTSEAIHNALKPFIHPSKFLKYL